MHVQDVLTHSSVQTETDTANLHLQSRQPAMQRLCLKAEHMYMCVDCHSSPLAIRADAEVGSLWCDLIGCKGPLLLLL